MAKQNHFLAKMNAIAEAKCAAQRRFTLQQAADMMLIAANEAFGFGPERLHRLLLAYQETWDEYADLALDDAAADKDIEYTRAKIDEKLRQICGPYYVEWGERYDG